MSRAEEVIEVRPPRVRFSRLREHGVPSAAPPIYESRSVAREAFAVGGAGGLAVWAGALLDGSGEPLTPVLLWGVPIWVACSLALAAVVGHEGARLRPGIWLFRLGGISTAVGVALAANATGGLASPLVVGFFLATSFQGFVLPLRDGLISLGGIVVAWLVVAVAGPASAADLAILQLPLFGLAWAIGGLAHGAYAEATADAVRLSSTDPVTGCLNRHGVERALEDGLALAQRNEGELGLLMLDLDDFKRINDTLGHAAGDELLVWIGEELRAALRAGTDVGRLGGDEFVAVMPGTTAREGPEVAERVTLRLMSRIGASVGWAASPGDGASADELLRAADARLYSMKQRRKGGRSVEPLA